MGEIFEKTFHEKMGIWLLMTRCSTPLVIRKFANENHDEVKFHTHCNGYNKKDNVISMGRHLQSRAIKRCWWKCKWIVPFSRPDKNFSSLNSFLISVYVYICVRVCTSEWRHPLSEKRVSDPLPSWFPYRAQVHLPRGGAGHSELGPPIIRNQVDNPQTCP